VRLGAVQALGNLGFKEAVPELSHIVDDEASPPLLIKKAIVSLGQLGDPAAIPALLHGLVLERSGVSFLPESSFALFLLGAPAVEPLLKILQDQDPAYLAWARDNNRAAAGTYAKAALVLGDLGDARAVPALLPKLKYTDPDPNPGTAKLLTNLVREFAANALGRLRAPDAAAPILALVQTKDPQDEGLTVFAGEALVWIGDRSQAKELLKRAQTGAIRSRLVAAQAASMLGDGPLARDLAAMAAREEKGATSSCLKALGELQMTAQNDKDACAMVAAQFGELIKPLEAAGRCSGTAACWMQLLQDKEPLVRARAAYELGRETYGQAVPELAKACSDPDLRVRTAAIRALEWLLALPAAKPLLKAAAAPLAAQLSAEQGKMEVSKVNEELRRLQARLSRL
jgi:HEAT repeat protein